MTATSDSSGKVVLVTGASRGLGRECALLFGREGARVVVNYKSRQDDAEEVATAICRSGGEAITVAADVAEPEQVSAMFEQVEAAFGRVDVLVANAAATAFKPLLEIRDHHIDKTLHISFHGFLLLVQRSVALMPAGGRVVAVSGWDSFRVMPGHGLLGAAKAAMEALVRYLAVELAPRGISVNAICPGLMATDSARTYAQRHAGENWPEMEKAWLRYSPMGRFAQPADIAYIVAFLASAQAGWLTGQTIVADGGLSLTSLPVDL